MKEKINQKAFIQIPLLIGIIVSIIVASVGAGVVLHKQGRLAPLVANISEVFKGAEEVTTGEEQEFELEQLQTEQEPGESQEEISQQELEKARLEAEKARLEAEAAKAKVEAEQLKKEAEEAKRLAEETRKQEELKEQKEVKIQCSLGAILCNNKCWSPCPTGQTFYCPSVGDAKCLIEESKRSGEIDSTTIDGAIEYLFNNSAIIISSKIWGEGDMFLGKIASKYDSDSVLNRYGNYGSKYSSDSIWNKYGSYGGKYSSYSPFNKYTSTPPKIYIGNTFWGYLSTNKYLSANVLNPNDLLLFAYLKYNDNRYLELMITD